MKVEVAVLGSRPPNKPTVSVDVKQHFNISCSKHWLSRKVPESEAGSVGAGCNRPTSQ